MALVGFLTFPLLLQAPSDSGRIEARVACLACRIARIPVVSLRGKEVGPPRAIAIVGGAVLLSAFEGDARGSIARFDLGTGRFVGLVGRLGRGPGEFTALGHLQAIEGDSVYAWDHGGYRFQVLSPGVLRFARGAPLTVRSSATSAVMARDRTTWVAFPALSGAQAGHPIHRYSPDGRWLNSFGGIAGPMDWRNQVRWSRVLAVAAEGVWSVSMQGPLLLELWGPTGQRLRAWYYRTGRDEAVMGVSDGSPRDRRIGIMADADLDRIWLLTWVADTRWREASRPAPGVGNFERGARAVQNLTLFYDSRLELIDVRRGEVLAVVTVDDLVSHLIPGGHLSIYEEDADGYPTVRIERLSLRLPSRPAAPRQH